ncbi:hypothetical protein C8R45DRAFT_843215 [Mycena sanguinolenta]|nr:hypothetical protein C8R45DRAFT_843215 [Mycena sanguinolenta]
MVLKMVAAAYAYWPTQYTPHAVTTLIALLATYRIAQGRRTTRERDLHGRVVLLTAAFTPLGLTLLEALATRGAHVIALTPHAVEEERVATYIDLVRTTTSNENVFAEECDLRDPASIKTFAEKFVSAPSVPTAPPRRLDALVCAHEYAGVGALRGFASSEEQRTRDEGALATFLLIILLLPSLLTAPVERDLRIVNVVNRWYAAAAPRFWADRTYEFPSAFTTTTTLLAEASRALRTVVLTRHLQRILDALPSTPIPDPSATSSSHSSNATSGSSKSNIIAVSVSPGLGAESVAPLFGGGVFGRLIHILLYPLLFLLTKSAHASAQSVLHVLFLPTVGKVCSCFSFWISKPTPGEEPDEALKAGALYAECAVVRVPVPAPPLSPPAPSPGSAAGGEKEKGREGKGERDGDAHDLGGERAGRAVWEAYEAGLRAWEARAAASAEGEKEKEKTGEEETRTS